MQQKQGWLRNDQIYEELYVRESTSTIVLPWQERRLPRASRKSQKTLPGKMSAQGQTVFWSPWYWSVLVLGCCMHEG